MILYTRHAVEKLLRFGIRAEWVEATVAAPTHVAPDPRQPGLTRSWAPVEELGGRMLRVVHRRDGDDVLIITAHFDRGARK